MNPARALQLAKESQEIAHCREHFARPQRWRGTGRALRYCPAGREWYEDGFVTPARLSPNLFMGSWQLITPAELAEERQQLMHQS